jgi:hypothetical protein
MACTVSARRTSPASVSTRRRPSTLVFEAWMLRHGRSLERWLHLDRGACGWSPLVPDRNRAGSP